MLNDPAIRTIPFRLAQAVGSSPLAFAGLLAASAVLYGWNLDRTPVHLNQDELGFALNAYSLVTHGVDESGRAWPLYFWRLGVMWATPLIVYATAFVLAFLPLSEGSIRLTSVLFGLSGVGLMYLVGARLFQGRAWGLVAGALLATSPAYFVHSRILLDNLYPVPFVIGWLLLLFRFHQGRGERWTLFTAGLVLGVGVHSAGPSSGPPVRQFGAPNRSGARGPSG